VHLPARRLISPRATGQAYFAARRSRETNIHLNPTEECLEPLEAAARLALIGTLLGEQAWVRLRSLGGRGSDIPCARPTEAYSGVPVRGTIS